MFQRGFQRKKGKHRGTESTEKKSRGEEKQRRRETEGKRSRGEEKQRGRETGKRGSLADFATRRALLVFKWLVLSGQWLLLPTTNTHEYSRIQNYR